MPNKYRGDVPVPEFGGGHFLRFSWRELSELESIYGNRWWEPVMDALESATISTLVDVYRIGMRNPDETLMSVKGEPVDLPDDLVPATAAEYAMDAIALAHRGKTYKAMIQELQDMLEKQGKEAKKTLDENPMTTSSESLDISESTPSEPD